MMVWCRKAISNPIFLIITPNITVILLPMIINVNINNNKYIMVQLLSVISHNYYHICYSASQYICSSSWYWLWADKECGFCILINLTTNVFMHKHLFIIVYPHFKTSLKKTCSSGMGDWFYFVLVYYSIFFTQLIFILFFH